MAQSNTAPRKKNTHIQLSVGDRAFVIFNYTFLAIILLLVLYPLIYIVSCSFSSPAAVTGGAVWLFPVDFSLVGYETVFKNSEIIPSFWNAVIITVFGTIINVICTLMAAYPLARKTLYGRGFITSLFAFTMLFNGGLIPTFLIVKQLGLYNSFFALWLPGAVSVYNMVVARTFFQTNIPEELYEAGELDGCSDIMFMLRIALPLAVPIIAVLVMFYAVGHWNGYFNALIYLNDKSKYPLQIILRNILIENRMDDASMMVDVEAMARKQGLAELLKYSLIVIGSLPMLILYPFVQKHFVKGVMIGALKG
ncbi:MAG: carbohydrate ABC transporter permease [Candidatus Fimadaptatus sp.]|jgi:putative aldouronate transport system permease protein